jgi:hypothetical protein
MARNAKVLITGLLLAGSTLFAQEVRAEQAGLTLPQKTDTADVVELGNAIPAADLEQQTGRYDMNMNMTIGEMSVVDNNLNQFANGFGNQIDNSGTINTGWNIVKDNAFSNASGIASLIQNTGNQVIIQNSLILNLLTK